MWQRCYGHLSHREDPACRSLAVRRDRSNGRKDLNRSARKCTAHVRDAKEPAYSNYRSMNVCDISFILRIKTDGKSMYRRSLLWMKFEQTGHFNTWMSVSQTEVVSLRCGEGGAHRVLQVAMGGKSSCLLCVLLIRAKPCCYLFVATRYHSKIYKFENYEWTFFFYCFKKSVLFFFSFFFFNFILFLNFT